MSRCVSPRTASRYYFQSREKIAEGSISYLRPLAASRPTEVFPPRGQSVWV